MCCNREEIKVIILSRLDLIYFCAAVQPFSHDSTHNAHHITSKGSSKNKTIHFINTTNKVTYYKVFWQPSVLPLGLLVYKRVSC